MELMLKESPTVALSNSISLLLTQGLTSVSLKVLLFLRNQCLEECRYKVIMESCACQPPYLPPWKGLPNCTFSQHATCISPQFMHFNFSIKCEDCPIECEKHSYGRNVEYGKYHEPIYRTLDKYSQSTGNTGIDIAAFQVLLYLVDFIIIIRVRFSFPNWKWPFIIKN